MRQAIHYFFLLFTLPYVAISNKRLELHLGFNDCITCYSALSLFTQLNTYDKTIIIAKEDSAVASEFLKNYAITANTRLVYGAQLVLGASYVLVYTNELKTDSFSLRSLREKLNSENGGEAGVKRIHLPSSFVVNKSRLDMSVSENAVTFYDYILNKVVSIRVNSQFDTIQKLTEIKGSAFDTPTFLIKGGIDTNLYRIVYPILKRDGESGPHIEAMYANDTVVSVLLNFPNPSVNQKNITDTIIGFAFFIYEKNLITDKVTLNFVNEESFLSEFKSRYMIKNGRPLFRTKSGLHLPITDFFNSDPNIRLFSIWRLKSGTFAFDKFDSVSIDQTYYKQNRLANFVCWVNHDFYFNSKLSLIVDIHHDRVIKPESYRIKSGPQFALDIIRSKGRIKVLVYNEQGVELLIYEDENNTLLEKKTLELPGDCNATSLKFTPDGEYVITLDKAFKTLIKLKL